MVRCSDGALEHAPFAWRRLRFFWLAFRCRWWVGATADWGLGWNGPGVSGSSSPSGAASGYNICTAAMHVGVRRCARMCVLARTGSASLLCPAHLAPKDTMPAVGLTFIPLTRRQAHNTPTHYQEQRLHDDGHDDVNDDRQQQGHQRILDQFEILTRAGTE